MSRFLELEQVIELINSERLPLSVNHKGRVLINPTSHDVPFSTWQQVRHYNDALRELLVNDDTRLWCSVEKAG